MTAKKPLVFLNRSVLSATLLGHWRQQHLKGTAFRSRFLLDLAHVLGVGNDTFEDAQPAILMDDFTPTEENRHFNAVSILKESLDMPDLGLEIVVVGLRTDLDFLDPAHAVLGYIPTRLCIKRSDSSSLHV